MNFINGVPHGQRIEWYENGEKKEVGSFVSGNQSGTWTYYNKDGSLDGTEEY
jgi:antitoxin component YwqK of YwqJK toxin-antitoxin module